MTECTTTASFERYGVDDGTEIVKRVHRRLEAGDGPHTAETFEELARAFRAVFRDAAAVDRVPAPVEAALSDALHFTRRAYLGSTADPRTAVVPEFYRHLAGFHCAYVDDRERRPVD